MGYAKEYYVERYFREAMIARIAPVSREMILNFIAERVLHLPKSYCRTRRPATSIGRHAAQRIGLRTGGAVRPGGAPGGARAQVEESPRDSALAPAEAGASGSRPPRRHVVLGAGGGGHLGAAGVDRASEMAAVDARPRRASWARIRRGRAGRARSIAAISFGAGLGAAWVVSVEVAIAAGATCRRVVWPGAIDFVDGFRAAGFDAVVDGRRLDCDERARGLRRVRQAGRGGSPSAR